MTELRGRTIAPIIDIGIIKEWMRACEVHHGYCKMLPPPSSNGNSFRLIDVQEQKIISSTQPERYIALSYVWGSSTYSSNYGLRAAKLPQTIVDCIQLVKGLGERYLWVDSLCIIQDDYDDKLEQLRTMDNVYRNAALVIVAAAGDDAHSGLCGIGHLQRREWQRRETVCGLPYMTAQPPLRDVLGRTIWNSRGWTFQEAILARRILFFTEEQVYWSCKCANWREDMAWETSHGISLSHPFDSYWESRAMNCRTAKYCQDVTAFTKREIKQQSDVIWAFMGILKLHSSRFPKGFIWGHPLERLDATLIWYGCFDSGHHRTAKYSLSYNGGMQSVQYPSWSWLSTDTQVTFGNPCGDGIISKVKWHEPLFFDDLTGFPSINGTLELDKQTKKLFSGSKGDVTKYGLLQCTAETVELLVVRSIYKSSQSGQSTENSEYVFNTSTGKHGFLLPSHPVPATIQFPSGETAGTLYIQNKFFVGCDQQLGQFVLLSSNAKNEADEICVEMPDGLDCGNISHGHACKHIQSYNIMLVERRGDITYRLALHTVESEVWQKVTTQKEHFILG
ncbi:heterokaryon incompatibility domain-containing protein [Trichoderma sp. SZMC 28014]